MGDHGLDQGISKMGKDWHCGPCPAPLHPPGIPGPQEPRYIHIYNGDHLVAVQTFLDHRIWGCVLGVTCVMIALSFGGLQRGVWDREEAIKGK